MAYLQDAPSSVHRMIKVLQNLGQYRHDPADVFRDLLDYGVACLLVDGDQERASQLQGRYGLDYGPLPELMQAWILTMDETISDDTKWADPLGTLYEYLASQSKRSWLGQFFTPPDLCDLMTQLTTNPTEPPRSQRVNDPACGSGRTLLSFNAYYPGNRLYGEDLDPICAKMTALNLALHGCQGQVVCWDSLGRNHWHFGYEINPYHRLGAPPVPHLIAITPEQSYVWQTLRDKIPAPEPTVPTQKPPVLAPKPSQLSLF